MPPRIIELHAEQWDEEVIKQVMEKHGLTRREFLNLYSLFNKYTAKTIGTLKKRHFGTDLYTAFRIPGIGVMAMKYNLLIYSLMRNGTLTEQAVPQAIPSIRRAVGNRKKTRKFLANIYTRYNDKLNLKKKYGI